ncbi:hypothetical protein GCM10027176_36890 [Actinoallomurus bryophytorum]|uniref:NB-ARC domain-containing protein n=2 Tax=Actinoallomurus bryophytorum TaxID=1490222 RepID=A0A543CIV4_9ACTN|nr:helix-turn-helix domain-containing protein [Actinoallomurus bryophytorum]TQL97015.1 NB-ARC domain-containing protein [Actinoallomurus bryophytorum]
MEDVKEFGTELRRLREAACLSLAQLARRTNYSKGHLSKIENGRARPNRLLARRCDEVLEASGVLSELAEVISAGRKSSTAVPGASPQPSALPRDTVNFYGRQAELAEILDALSQAGKDGPGIVATCAVVGMGGVGKTALAVRAAHRLRPLFPDGCLFLDLHGYAGNAAVTSADALDRLLRRLGISGDRIPRHIEDRSALFSDSLTGRSVLLVLDNAFDVAQILPLLPGVGTCGVLITSRNELKALEDAHHVRLGSLPRADVRELLRALGTTDSAVEEIVEWCGGLPLALRIASARHREELDGDLLRSSGDSVHRLRELEDGERSLTSVFDASLRTLPPELVRTYLLLGLHPGPDFGLEAAAALAGIEARTASTRLRRLLDASLLTGSSAGRLSFHDLLRLFADERASALLSEAERISALRRGIDYYLRTLELADRHVTPNRHRMPSVSDQGPRREIDDYAEAIGWIAAEQDNLVTVGRAAYAAGLDSHCWRLAYALRGFLFLARAWDVWFETHELALRAARRAGELDAEAKTRNNLGLAFLEHGDHMAAAAQYDQALRIFQRLGNVHGEHTTIAHRAWVYFRQGDPHRALEDSLKALAFVERHGLYRNQAILARDIALIEIELGRNTEAVAHLSAALEVFNTLGLRLDAAMALNCLGELYHRVGQLADAEETLLRAAELARSCGSSFEEARAHEDLGAVAADTFDWDRVRWHWNAAMARYVDLHDTSRAELLRARLEALPSAPTDPDSAVAGPWRSMRYGEEYHRPEGD